MYNRVFKRGIDCAFSLLGLVILLPLLTIVTILLSFVNNGKPFFVQKRPGKNGHIFKVIKFKTMNDRIDDFGSLLPDEDRLTIIGKIIRKTSIDELPQLFNVFIGDMSLVGPRPLLIEYLALYNDRHKRRHDVRPGITGWAQVNGRNAISWEEKLDLDIWYVDNFSFWIDLKILWLTIYKVFRGEGINSEGQATMEKFTGNL
jgi:undecaprenyl phosphate N,N'-diacetylbacillosamine 1-phosphate transferase